MRTILPAALSIVLPLLAEAQDPPTTSMVEQPFGPMYWASAADSADYSVFRKGMSMVEETLETTSGNYRAGWRISEHGGIAVVTRGDGSLLRIEGPSITGLFMHLPFRMTDGRRGFIVVHETPCGLICRDTVYYVQE